ncbi:DeoR/GlpR family DNA-binding transcription regulator [Ligilactobacillus saerimneri]|uniref:DeoR family transcriptional regulator n=2 Tax=Ligilactobacillus saerimneri TaxID=228229 RepID=M5J5R9_9LACO|nr:DeoR/GlpR family DNA-binding transcription regulator [Ligilactobacillus saerimneri]EKW98530.1 DeoR family transcriptional regulator [Ligilactobacillus saerimneri 30a]MBU5309125.1 DeoR/GlpR family DNA-binding transcription regulator [Ligilactobacillus saerimneri]MCZ0891751.1 DeoR/GlpR family DNA-binding transcription regulator [Ligilactobacillus saerimneri]MDI9205757.1 DeoR/GlpR family DNA-binding transcription regulator [Ligilactobacillus saerimneri]MDY4003719.1 DeoR/GlpR family DNA-binding
MSQEKRIELIKQLLEERQELSTKDIMREFGISQDTARRDIVLLTKRGEVKRTHGGILPLDFGRSVPNFQSRLASFTKEKTQIALKAVEYFKPHHVYFVDSSTILLKTCQNLSLPLTVVTHSLDNCIALSEHNKVKVKVLSGTLDHENRFFYSNLAIQELNNVVFDTAFVAASGIDENGIYLLDQGDAEIVGLAAKRARKVILVAEHQKFVNNSYYRICSLDKISIFITDQELTKEQRAMFSPDTQIVVASNKDK